MRVHYLWMFFIICVIAWYSWFHRYQDDRGLYFLDRWTGEVVHPVQEPKPFKENGKTFRVDEVKKVSPFEDLIPKESD